MTNKVKRTIEKEIKNCSFDFLKTWGDLTSVKTRVFLLEINNFVSVAVFKDQSFKNETKLLLFSLLFK
jgi:hypothetical protein